MYIIILEVAYLKLLYFRQVSDLCSYNFTRDADKVEQTPESQIVFCPMPVIYE